MVTTFQHFQEAFQRKPWKEIHFFAYSQELSNSTSRKDCGLSVDALSLIGAIETEIAIETAAAAGAIIRARRTARGRSQHALADMAALGVTLAATDPIPRGSDFDPSRRDYAATFTRLIARRDFEFAIEMLADYANASITAGRPLLQRSPRLTDQRWSAALAGITNYTAHCLGQPAPCWTRRIKPLDAAWMPAESCRSVRTPMKELTRAETPPELAASNVFIRERSVATA